MAAFNAAYDAVVEAELEHGIPLRPGARELVAYLADEGTPAGDRHLVAAPDGRALSRPRRAARPFRRDRVARGRRESKARPDPFLAAAARLGLAPADCLALEDSYHGIASAHAAGMMAIMVPDLLAVTDAVRKQCITIVDDLHAVGALIREARISSAAVGQFVIGPRAVSQAFASLSTPWSS
jgi:beta-phosphoglucomutase-like phosphatase (HAD superfamily)